MNIIFHEYANRNLAYEAGLGTIKLNGSTIYVSIIVKGRLRTRFRSDFFLLKTVLLGTYFVFDQGQMQYIIRVSRRPTRSYHQFRTLHIDMFYCQHIIRVFYRLREHRKRKHKILFQFIVVPLR